MGDIIEKTMQRATFDANPDYDVYVKTDAEARKIASSLIHNYDFFCNRKIETVLRNMILNIEERGF